MFDDAPLFGSGSRTKRMSRRATVSPKRGGCAIAEIADNGGSGAGGGSFCYLLTNRLNPAYRQALGALQWQP